PAGEDWARYQQLIDAVGRHHLVLQMGYMFRYQDAFQKVAVWARDGLLGDVFGIRAHMSTWIPIYGGANTRDTIGRHHVGGVLYVPTANTTRQQSYDLELAAFVPAALGDRPPDRPLEHEILVQETLLRATGHIA